jgi:hypothetical protein
MATVTTRGSTKRKYEEELESFSYPAPTSATDCLEQSYVKRVIKEYVNPKTRTTLRLVYEPTLVPLDVVEDFKGSFDFQVYDPHPEIEFIKFMDGISFI